MTFSEEWQALRDIPINNEGQIEQEYLDFTVGTDIMDIWHYLEDKYNVVLGDMFND